MHRTWRAASRSVAVATGAMAFLVLIASPAAAHAVLESTNPPDGTIYPIAAPPTSVNMHFDEDVGVKLGAVRVYDDHGHLVNSGAPGHPPGDGSTVIATLPALKAGTYVVTWRVISADTHPVGGAFTFTVGSRSEDVSKLATRLLSSANGSRAVGVAYGIERFVLFAALIVLLGGTAFVTIVWPRGRCSPRAVGILWGALAVAIVVTALGFLVEGIYAAAFPFGRILNSTVLDATFHERFGETASARFFLLLLCAAPLLWVAVPLRAAPDRERQGLPRWWPPAAVIVALATLVTVTLASHGTTGRWTGLAVPADLLHLSAVALWLGGLFMLALAVVPGTDAETLDQVAPRYSNFAFGAVIVIVLSGTFQAVRQVGTMHALFATTYGRILLAKLAAFAVLIVVAAFSRQVVVDHYSLRRYRRRRAAQLVAAGAVTTEEATPVDTRVDSPDRERAAYLRLRGTVTAEVAIAVVVLMLTALLVDARPAYEITTGPQVFTMKSAVDAPPVVWFNVVVEPAVSGSNQIHITTETPEGAVAKPLQLTMELSNPKHDIGPLQVPLLRFGPGHYVQNATEFPFAGTWQITLRALMTPIDESDASHDVTIR